MADDPLARAREALEQARGAATANPDAIAPLLLEALDHLARGLDLLSEKERNLAIQQALLDDRLLRVERNRLFTTFARITSAGTKLLRRAGFGAEPETDPGAYALWVNHESAAQPDPKHAREALRSLPTSPTISVLLVSRGSEAFGECLQSLGGQPYGNWELCAALNPAKQSVPAGFSAPARVVSSDSLSDAQALNAAAALATGEYLCLIEDHGILSPLAFYYLAEALARDAWDVVYSDEDSLDAERRRVNPLFKPDWSPELLQASMYLGHPLIVRRERFVADGGFATDAGDAHVFDLLLRLAEESLRVHHIPRILYHRLGAKPFSGPQAAPQAITRAIARREKIESNCVAGPAPGTWIARRKRPPEAMTAIVCSKSPELLETCLASLRETARSIVKQVIVVAHEEAGENPDLRTVIQAAGATALPYLGPFHFAAMNNLGAAQADGPNLLFLNDDVTAGEPGWAEWLAEEVSREEVGVAGAVLWYPEGVLQHAGIVVGIHDGVGHAGRFQRSSRLWPWLLATREVSAVTGACLAIRKSLFEKLGGFDGRFPNNFNDVDLCFRARATGYRVVCVPAGGLIHAECQSRPGVVRFEERYRFFQRWGEVLRRPDPYYSRSLAPTERIELNLKGEDWRGAPPNPRDQSK